MHFVRVLADLIPCGPSPSLRCVTVVSGPISGLYFLRSRSAMWSIHEHCAHPGSIREDDKGAFGVHVGFGETKALGVLSCSVV